MEGVLQVAGMDRSSGGSGGRAPLSSIPRNTAGSVASGRSRKSGRRGSASRAQAGSAQAESHHVQRLRASRSAGDIGFSSSLYAPSSVEKPLLAQASLYASASAAELGGFGFDKQSSQRSRRVGSAPRERLAARRRSNKPADKSARMVSAVQGLDQSSKQALLGVIKMERERKTTQQQREAELEQMHQEAAHNSRSAESEQQVFDALGMLDSTEVAQQAEAGLRILQFCATAPEPCHAMMSRALAVFARLRQAHGDVAAERDAAVQQERRKWHEKEVEAERRHKEAASKLGASLGSEMQTMKQQLASASADRDAAQKQVEELKATQAKDARKIERLSAKVAELQSDAESGAGASDKAADAEVLSLRDAVAAAESELSTMKTRLKKMMAKGKKDKATIEELNEAVEHNRAQLGAQMEENETLRTAIDALQTPAKSEPESEPQPSAQESEDLTDFAGKLKDLEIAASRGQAPTLNIERGTGEPSPSALDAEPVDLEADLSALEQQGADAGESVFGSLDIGDLTVSDSPAGKADGMFGTDDTSPIAATDTTTMVLAAEKSSGDLDAAFTAVGEVESLKRECDELRLRNAELEAALTDALGSDDESDDDTPLSCAKKLADKSPMAPLDRPSIVPALDFESLAEKLAAADKAEAEAEAAEKASKGESTVLEEVIDPEYVPTEKDIAEYAAFLGLDMEAEPELAWIASKGLVTPLPEGWKPCAAPSGELYYFNFDTGDSVWEHPGDEYYRALLAAEREKLKAAA